MLWFVVLSHSVVGAICYLKTLNKGFPGGPGVKDPPCSGLGRSHMPCVGQPARVSQLLSRRSPREPQLLQPPCLGAHAPRERPPQ